MTAAVAPYPNLGYFVIDPDDPEFEIFFRMSDPGSGWACLIAQYIRHHIVEAKYPYADLAVGARKTIAITCGNWRYTRLMTKDEIDLAKGFDETPPRRPAKVVTVDFDMRDGKWKAKPKTSPRKTPSRSGATGPARRQKSARSRYRDEMKRFNATPN